MSMNWTDWRLLMLILFAVGLMLHSSRGCHEPDTGSTFNESSQNSSVRKKFDHNKNVILGYSFTIAAGENVIIVLIIYMTKNTDRNTSYLLIAQCVVDFVVEIWGVLIFLQAICSIDRLSFCIITTFRALSLHILKVSIFNIYIAVCKPTLYSKYRPWTYKLAVAMLILVSESALHVMYLYSDTSFYLDDGSTAPTPTYSPTNWWIGALIILYNVLFPVTVTILCQYKIHQFAKGCSASTRRHIKLSYLIAGMTVITVVTFLIPHILRALRIYNFLLTASVILSMLFNFLKIPYYLVVYKPFRDTVKSYINCVEVCKRRTKTTRPVTS